MARTYAASVSERTFYPALLDVIRAKGGTGVQEVVYKSVPDIKFTLKGEPWLLSVKIGESLTLIKSAFLQYLRHKEESGIERGLLLLLPDEVKRTAANEEAVREAIDKTHVAVLVDALSIKDELRDRTFADVIDFIQTDVEPRVERGIASSYSLNLVIGLLREQVTEVMRELRVRERRILKVITSWKLLSGLAHLAPTDAKQAGKFLAAYIILSQILFLRLFSVVHPEITKDIKPVTRKKLREAFGRVLEINYKPIFELDVLELVEEHYLHDTFDLIWGLAVDKVRYELPGRIFHELMPRDIRKILAAFYTRPQAAELLSQLSLTSPHDTVFDPACGSGTILTAAYREKLKLYKRSGAAGNPHRRFCEEEIYGSDVMPFAVHLTCANLAAMDVGEIITHTKILQADSLDIDPGEGYRDGVQQFGLFERPKEAKKLTGETYNIVLQTGSMNVVMMNPPFTKVERGIKRFVNMERYKRSVGGEVGLWGHFVFLADTFLRKDGRTGAVIPINLLRGRESSLTRRFVFSKWTPLYVIKCTRNYGFSEWAEYRDILFVAKKKDCPATHKVRFCLLKKDLRTLRHDDIEHLREQIESQEKLRSAELDIDSHAVRELQPRMDNLMWFCGVTDLQHRDLIIAFLKNFEDKLNPFPVDYVTTGYRPDGDVSDFMFVTRTTTADRVKEAFLRFDKEGRTEIEAKSPLDAEYKIELDSLTPSLRTPVGLRAMGIGTGWDYVANRPYKELNRVRRAAGFARTADWREYWENIEQLLARTQTHLSVVHRINPFSPNIHHVAFFSSTKLSASDQFNIFAESEPYIGKALCALLNSCLFFAQFFLLKEESTGRFINVRVYDLEQMVIFPDDKQVEALVRVFDKFGAVKFPSIGEQFDANFAQRYDEFWEKEKSGGRQAKLWPVLDKPVEPSEARLNFDLAVCEALGADIDKEDLVELYHVFVREMIMTRGLTKD
jgi:hypothetical protein